MSSVWETRWGLSDRSQACCGRSVCHTCRGLDQRALSACRLRRARRSKGGRRTGSEGGTQSLLIARIYRTCRSVMAPQKRRLINGPSIPPPPFPASGPGYFLEKRQPVTLHFLSLTGPAAVCPTHPDTFTLTLNGRGPHLCDQLHILARGRLIPFAQHLKVMIHWATRCCSQPGETKDIWMSAKSSPLAIQSF